MAKRKTRAELEWEIYRLDAARLGNLHAAKAELKRMSVKNLLGSACIISISGYGANDKRVPPFALYGGLSDKAIEVLQEEIDRSIKGILEGSLFGTWEKKDAGNR